MLRDTFFRKAWISRLMAATRRGGDAASEPMPVVACDEHGEPEPVSVSGAEGVHIHSLDTTGYGVFRDRGFWLVTWGGRWFQASVLEGPYVPVAPSQVSVLLVAAVAHARTVPADRDARIVSATL